MNSDLNFSIDNRLTLISLIFVAIGGIFIFFQWRKSNKTKRAEFIYQILEKIRFNENLTDTMYVIDYNQNWYNEAFHASEMEKSIDLLLSYLDYICYLKTTKNISKKEFNIFKYEIHRVCISHSTKQYLWNLFHFSKKNNTNCSFQYLIDYGIDYRLLPKDFKTNQSIYSKTLNW